MTWKSLIRVAALLPLCGAALAQVRHPKPSATMPVSQPVMAPQAAPTPQTPAQMPPQRAQVTYSDGQLAVQANNSSLNQILRQIEHETGIKVTGGVAEERVFGKYGPGSTDSVLNALLDGTESNMLLVQRDTSSPGELILTPRHGGPTPPNPNAESFDEDQDDAADHSRPAPPQQLHPPYPRPIPEQPPATAAPGSAPTTSGTGNGGSTQSPNGVKTPQQIYEQLQRMQQQQQQPPQ